MKKKWLFVLAMAALFCLLAVGASADTPIMTTDGSETTLEACIEGRPMVIVFGRTTCGNTQAFLQGASSNAEKLARYKIGVIALMDTQYNDPTPVELTEFASNYPGVTIAKELGSVPFWGWLSQIGQGTNSVTYPVVFVRGADGKLLYGSTGYVEDNAAFATKAIQLITGEYVPVTYTLTVRFLLLHDDSEIAPAFIAEYQEGETYRITTPTVPGYTRSGNDITGTMPANDYDIDVYYDSIDDPYPDTPAINLTVDKEKVALNEPFYFNYEILYTKRLNAPFGIWKIYEWRDGVSTLADRSMFGDHLSDEGSYTVADPDVDKITIQVLLGDQGREYAVTYEERIILVEQTPDEPTPTPTPAVTATPTQVPETPTQDPSTSTPAPTAEPDGITAFVTRCYELILGRKPDTGGLETWYNELNSGRKAASEIIDRFVNSPEFLGKQYTNGKAVEILYKAMLGRSSDPSGKANWVSKLDAGRPFAVVINGFCVSKEFNEICASYGIRPGSVTIPEEEPKTPDEKIKAFVRRCYQIILSREPDTGGMETWFNELKSRRKAASEIIDRFVNSPEFSGKNYSHAESVEILYKAMLGRGSDPAGKANWVAKLNAGKPFAVVINGFCISPEFRGICESYGITPGTVKIQNLNGASEEKSLSSLVLNAAEPITKKSEEKPGRVEVINPSDTVDVTIGTAVKAIYINEQKAREYICRCYRYILGREAGKEELDHWAGQMISGTKTADQIARGFLFSEEFKGKNTSNEDLVRILYKVYLNREADPEGLQTWRRKLEEGMTLRELLDIFAKTKEFRDAVSDMGK